MVNRKETNLISIIYEQLLLVLSLFVVAFQRPASSSELFLVW